MNQQQEFQNNPQGVRNRAQSSIRKGSNHRMQQQNRQSTNRSQLSGSKHEGVTSYIATPDMQAKQQMQTLPVRGQSGSSRPIPHGRLSSKTRPHIPIAQQHQMQQNQQQPGQSFRSSSQLRQMVPPTSNQQNQFKHSTIESEQSVSTQYNERPLQNQNNRFRIAQPPSQANQVTDVSGKYWNQISNHINTEKRFIEQKLLSSRGLNSQFGGTQLSGAFDGALSVQNARVPVLSSLNKPMVGTNFGQTQRNQEQPGPGALSSVPSDKDLLMRSTLSNNQTPLAMGGTGLFGKADLDQFQRPFQFLANLGGKETSQSKFTTRIDKNLLKNQKSLQRNQLQTIQNQSLKEGGGPSNVGDSTAAEFVTFNQSKNVQELLTQKPGGLTMTIDQDDTTKVGQITIFTDLNVDKHQFDIREKRKAQRATSALQRPQSTFRSQKSSIQVGIVGLKQTLQGALNFPPSLPQDQKQRPISSLLPSQTKSQKLLNPFQSKVPPLGGLQKLQKEFKISSGKGGAAGGRRPFSANPKYMQLAGFQRPFSAMVKMGEQPSKKNEVPSVEDEDEEDEEYGDEYVDLNIYEVPEEDKFDVKQEPESFSHRIMNSRPTTAYKKEKNFDLPFPELFDRSERTFAATFARYGDLSYYTPVQRIGSYMDFSARLKKRHLIDLIAYMRTSKKPIKPSDEEINEPEQAQKDYEDNSLFIGVMPEEDNPRLTQVGAGQTIQKDQVQPPIQENADGKDKVFDQTQTKFEGSFQYQQVWSETLMNQVQLSIHRFFKYLESPDAIKNEEISKYKKEWMSHALDLVPDQLLSTHSSLVRKLFSEVFNFYARAIKQSILEYILRSPEERKRLHIVMLPRPIPTATERQLMRGGYDVEKYRASHDRKKEVESEIKLRLLNNNIVISALQSWFKDFRSFNLVEFKGLAQFVMELQQDQHQTMSTHHNASHHLASSRTQGLHHQQQSSHIHNQTHQHLGDQRGAQHNQSQYHSGGGAATSASPVQCYSMDVDNFISLQEAYRQKVLQVMKHVWHRGCMLIIKKFKVMRLREQQQAIQNASGKASIGKWTFEGYNPVPQDSEEGEQRAYTSEIKWEEIDKFELSLVLGKQHQLLKYYSRTGMVHQSVPLTYFQTEEGFSFTSIPPQYRAELDLDDLVDIRENSAYLAFVELIKGYVNFEENGYEILSKQYKREIKYAAGNLMKLQLRQVVDKAVDTIRNFFTGFLTFEHLKKALGGKIMRQIRIFVTRTDKVNSAEQMLQEAEAKRKKEEEQKAQQQQKGAAKKARRGNQPPSKVQETKEFETKPKLDTKWDVDPILQLPDYFDFQDYVNPIFRLELTLVHGGGRQSDGGMMSSSHLQPSPTPNQTATGGFFSSNLAHGDTLEFSKREQDIIEEFELWFLRTVTSFNQFLVRPEFAKVKVISKKRYEGDLEEEARLKKLNVQVKKPNNALSHSTIKSHHHPTTINNNNDTIKNHQSFNMLSPNSQAHGPSANQTQMSASHMGQGGQKVKDYDSILYNYHEDGEQVYKKFLGRIQIFESDKNTKDLIDENNMGIYSRPYVEKYYQIADPEGEEGYQQVSHQIKKILSRHLKETKRVTEIFEQFKDIIKGSLQQRVKDFVADNDKRDKDFELLIKELKFYQKLSTQLPTIVFFPMFEVGTGTIKDEIQRRLRTLLASVFRKFESQMVTRSQGISEKYLQICKYLDKQLKTPQDVVEMERYKNNLLLEMGALQERMYENRRAMFFLLRNDKMFEDDSWALVKELHEWPSRLNAHMDLADDRHRNERNDIENFVVKKRDIFETQVALLEENVKEVMQWGDLASYRIVINKILDYQQQIDGFEEQMLEISSEEMMLFGFKSNFESFHRVKKFYSPFYELWTNVSEIIIKKRQWMESALANIDPDEVDGMIKQSIKTLTKLQKSLKDNQLAQKVINSLSGEVNELNEWLPTIEVLCNPSLKTRHWTEIQHIAKANFNYQKISLSEVKYFNVKDYLDQLAEISEKAKKEARLEKMLDKMENEWVDLRFELTTFRDTGIPILQGQNVEEIQLILDEHTLTAQTIRGSPDVAPMQQRAIDWERLMTFLQEVLDVWIRVQANYLYLEPIFHSEDITKKLPLEAREFTKIDKMWRDVMLRVQQDTLVLHLNKIKNLQTNLDDANSALDRIQKSLNEYLETKRQYFPRFYFLSNEDLLEILGDSKNPFKVQRHLKKCFEGINEVVFKAGTVNTGAHKHTDESEVNANEEEQNEEIVAIVSREHERVELVKSIFPQEHKGNVEVWLLELETNMKQSVQAVIAESISDYNRSATQTRERWIGNWQSQVVLAVSQIMWTRAIEEALKQGNAGNGSQAAKAMDQYFKKCQRQLDEIVNLVRNELPDLMRMTLGSLIVIDLHAKDTLQNLMSEGVTSLDDFSWLAQLRYYFQQAHKHVVAKMITTTQDYGYEYLGNTTRLVITPLTDRCYRTLMSALHLNLGGAPEGPAGTGKTESTKDLAKAIAIHCMVFNCAEGLNAKAMAKFFKGLASAGSWSCFDEFNRIELEVLSVVAQQILEIQRAKNQQKEIFFFEDADISLKPSCNAFITMNPGYAGRSELPDNLKALFRPVAMMMPDYTMIAEISLYSFGFFESRNLAKKIVATYRLCSEQLSSQYHYDYGMRAVKAVLTAAKMLKQKHPQEREDILILRSINDVNQPKFLSQDLPLFKGITEDLFQGTIMPEIQYGDLDTHVRRVVREMNFQESKPFLEKVFQLMEMINCRHGLMLVGPPYGGKTSIYKVLAEALRGVAKDNSKLKELPVDTYVINPKSITLSQLYGSFDPISQDFTDGILGQLFRRCAYKDVGKSRRWLVFDGPVDAEWIENMNTVLDDNKKLCLLNGEVIAMNDQMNLIFETHDLSQASPATVSRCGMVYMQPENVGWQALLASWLEQLKQKTHGSQGESFDPSLVKRIEDLFEIFFCQGYTFLRKKCSTHVPVSEIQLAHSLMKIYQSLLIQPSFLDMAYNPKIKNEDVVNRIDMFFLFALVWSVGAVADEAGQKNFSYFLRKICTDVYKVRGNKSLKVDKLAQIPDGGSIVQNYFLEEQRWVSWKDVLDKNDSNKEFDPSLTYHELIVPTTENLKNTFLLNLCIKNGMPVNFVGPTGTGKSVLVQKYLRQLPIDNFTTIQICFSAKTTANQTQEIIDSKLEKRGRRIMGPPLGKKCVIFVDDLNMPQLEKYGAQPPIELLRQWMDHKGWYDTKEKEKTFKELIDLIFVTAMGPPGGGKNPITPRYLRHFNLVSINNFDELVLQRIFSKLMDWHLRKSNFSPTSDAFRTLQAVVSGTVDVFLYAQQELRPTPTKSHYLFNLRDLSRVIQGIQLGRKEDFNDSKKVLRLWVHEVARVFSDRLINEEDQTKLYERLFVSSREKIKEDLITALKFQFGDMSTKVENNKDIMTRYLMFGDVLGEGISTQDRKYDEIGPSSKKLLTDKMINFLEDFNSVSKKPMNLVLFDFAVMHVLRICRVLRMSNGNAFLIGVGGSGRQSLSKLATFICDYGLVEVEQSKNYNVEQWKDDMKRLVLLAGQDCKNTVFLLSDSQIKFSFMLEDINNLLNAGEIPNLFQADEKLQIVEKLRPVAKREGRTQLYNNGTNEQFQDYFVEKTKQHLHVILAMSPIGNALRERIRNFPSLVNCCTFDWFTTWPEDALEAVAEQFLSEGEVDGSQKQSIIKLCKKIHTDMIALSSKYLTEQKRHNYVTPTSYLELILTYKELVKKTRQKTLTLKLGYDKGIEKLLFTAEEVTKMQQDLNEKQPRLAQMTVETDILMEKIQKESREVVEPKKAQIQEEEAIANQMAQEAQTIKIECENDLSKALPLVKKAQEALNTIQSSHINEVKSLGKPPEPIKKVLHAVCIMCQRKVEKTPKKENPKELEENWWYTAQKFMSEKNFLESLLAYDKDNIPETVMNKIRTNFLSDPDFKPQRVEKASFAAKGLCMWIRALDQYDRVAKIIAPKRLRAKEAEAKYKETLDGLRKKQAELKEIVDQFEMLQAQLDETSRRKKRLQDDIEDCSRKLDRAQTLIVGLGGEQKRWEEATLELGVLYENLIGDILLSAAVICYLGAFTSIYRNQALQNWTIDMRNLKINASNTAIFQLQSILGEPVTIRQWNLCGLPTDQFSVDNGIVVFNARRWPLMIDPQGQANRWIKNLEGSNSASTGSKLQILKMSDPDFVRVFEQSIQLGFPILLENIGEDLDPLLEPLLLKQTFKAAGIVSINFGDNIIEYSPDFRLYITTKLPNPHYLPELSTKVTLLNFMITFDGLKDYLLNLVVQKENAALDDERQRLIVQSYENNRTLKEVENKILDVLRTSQGNILDDEKAIDVLKQSQVLSKQIKEKQEVAAVTEKKLEEARRSYMPIASHSSLLFFIIQKLSQIDVMYQYSLTWYIQLFLMAIENSEKSEFIEQRIEQLKNYFTYSLYSNVCRSLFEKHKLLFSFILTAKLRESEKKVQPALYEFMISTLPGLENPIEMENPCEGWLPNQIWNRLGELSLTESQFSTIVQDFLKYEHYWKKIYDSNFPHKETFPSANKEGMQFDIFSRLCIIKVLRPDKIVPALKEYVISEMGEQFVNPPLFDLELSFNDSTFNTPLIFVLPGADPLQSLTAFATSKKKIETMKSISLGQDQGPKAERAIEEAKRQGGWVLLQNCHLYPSWMPKLERICEGLDMKIGGKEVAHPSFRLWLTSYPSADFPVLILQNGIKMTNEPPKGLKANIMGSFKNEPIADPNFFNIHNKLPVFKKMLFGLCMFHAIIQERRNYGSLGWNIRYEFTVSDLNISVKQLHAFTNEYAEVPYKALRYLTGECNYGGRVTDDRDRKVLKALLQDFYNPKIMEDEFAACSLDDYMFPIGNLHHTKYLEFISRLPLEEPPSLFGFHPNANITKELSETQELCYDLLKMGEIEGVKQCASAYDQAQNASVGGVPSQNADSQYASIQSANSQSFAAGGSMLKRQATKKDDAAAKVKIEQAKTPEQQIEKICKDILVKLPTSLFDIEAVQAKYPLIRENSMNTFLVQELTRFNNLLKVIQSTLKSILLALKGEVLLSEQLEKVYNSLLIGEIPSMWLAQSYPSLKNVASYIKDLVLRLNTYSQWIQNGPPPVFWISGFFFTQSFLTGIFQNYARKYKIEIDTLVYDFKYLAEEDTTDYENEVYVNEKGKRPKHSAPEDGAYISGLYLEGARWDYQKQTLNESNPKILFCKMPIIWLQPTKVQNRQLISKGDGQVVEEEFIIYECPMYKTAERKGVLSTTGHSTNFIMNVKLPTGDYHSSHWVKRGVAMICQLSN